MNNTLLTKVIEQQIDINRFILLPSEVSNQQLWPHRHSAQLGEEAKVYGAAVAAKLCAEFQRDTQSTRCWATRIFQCMTSLHL